MRVVLAGGGTGVLVLSQVVLSFDDNRLASLLFGQYGQNIALVERRLGVVVDADLDVAAREGRIAPRVAGVGRGHE